VRGLRLLWKASVGAGAKRRHMRFAIDKRVGRRSGKPKESDLDEVFRTDAGLVVMDRPSAGSGRCSNVFHGRFGTGLTVSVDLALAQGKNTTRTQHQDLRFLYDRGLRVGTRDGQRARARPGRRLRGAERPAPAGGAPAATPGSGGAATTATACAARATNSPGKRAGGRPPEQAVQEGVRHGGAPAELGAGFLKEEEVDEDEDEEE